MKVADFFCGGGGFSEGFRQAGFDIVFAVDKWLPAVKTYKANKPKTNVLHDDIIRISNLPDLEFNALVPDTEVIIGSPPCQSFSHSNKSGNADKSIGIKLIEAYLRIIARKKFKKNSILRYWVLENVPAVEKYIKDIYTAKDLNLSGNFILCTRGDGTGKYNAKYFGAPTNRERYLCGDFPRPIMTHNESNIVTLGDVLSSLGDPLNSNDDVVYDINYPSLSMKRSDITDHHYLYELAEFEWKTAKRLKQDKGYMGRMSFPENLNKPARTVMATMTASSREAMILGYGENRYRLPTVREVASIMSFPIDYWFCGDSKGIKHTLVGNAVPPKLSYAVAVAIAKKEDLDVPTQYIKIKHDINDFYNLNGQHFDIKIEKKRRSGSKFKYHIPYLIVESYRVELTNYYSDFEQKQFNWKVEIHYSQGKYKAKVYRPFVDISLIPYNYRDEVKKYLLKLYELPFNFNLFQQIYCMTTQEKQDNSLVGPYELLDMIRSFIDNTLEKSAWNKSIEIKQNELILHLPLAILIGYYILINFIENNPKNGERK